MNIRLDSKEIRFRLSQEEVKVLLDKEFIREQIILPGYQIDFQIKLGEQTQIGNEAGALVFLLSPAVRDSLKITTEFRDPLAMVYEEIKGKKICFKLEVDAFNAKQRGQRK